MEANNMNPDQNHPLIRLLSASNDLLLYRLPDFCLIDLNLYVASTIFPLCRDGSSSVEPVLS